MQNSNDQHFQNLEQGFEIGGGKAGTKVLKVEGANVDIVASTPTVLSLQEQNGYVTVQDAALPENTIPIADADGILTGGIVSTISETLTFGGGTTGDVATLTVVNGVITAKTLVP